MGKHIKRHGKPLPESVRDSLIRWLSLGKTLAAWCRENKIARRTVYVWIENDERLAGQIKQARDEGFEALAEECLEIVDTEPEITGNRGRDAAYVAWQRARVETRLRLLAAWDPKKYHPKFQHQHEGGLTLQVTTGVQRAAEAAAEEVAQKSIASPLQAALPPLSESEEVEIKDADYEVVERESEEAEAD